MAKHAPVKEPVLVTKIVEGTSKNGGHKMFTIYFIGLKSKRDYHTYVEVINNNYANWRAIIDAYERGKGIIINNVKHTGNLYRRKQSQRTRAVKPNKKRPS